MRAKYLCTVILSFALLSNAARAGGGPQNVALVVNSESWASLALANEFIRLRQIPPGNVIYLDNVPNFEVVDINVFRDKILKPVLAALEQRHLTSQIDYVVYSSDFPYAINTMPDRPIVTRVNSPIASITGMTFLYERVLQKDARYLHLNTNRYMRSGKEPQDTPLTSDEDKKYIQCLLITGRDTGKNKKALPLLQELHAAHPKNLEILFSLACCLALLNKKDEAMAVLNESADSGWFNAPGMLQSDDLESLRKRDDFKALIRKLEKMTVEIQPTQGFRAADAWDAQGEIALDGKGEHYLLSTMLAATSGRGLSVGEALDNLGRSARADATFPTGTIYFMWNDNVRSTTRRWAFKSAAAQLAELGIKSEIADGILPMKKPDVMGAVIGTDSFDWKSSSSVILPGAICEHLTSYGGILTQRSPQTPCTALLCCGAAGSSGTVQEPYALQEKFPVPFIHVHYARGCSLAESFYQSVAGPYQLLVVGDPLCAPWLRAPSVTLGGVAPNETLKGTATLTPSAAVPADVRSFELFVDGVRHSACKPGNTFSLNTVILCDGFHMLTLVGIHAGPIAGQSRITLPVTVENHGLSVALSMTEKGSVQWDKSVHLTASMKGASAIDLFANGRLAAQIKEGTGEFSIPAATVGMGTVRFQALARLAQSDAIAAASAPLEIQVEPAWIGPAGNNPAATKNGLLLTFDNGKTMVVMPSPDGNWLKNAGLKAAHGCTAEAWFDAPADDLFQFQIQTPAKMSLEVDGIEQPLASRAAWQFVPLALRKGAHRFRFRIAADQEPYADVRWGSSGTKSIEGAQFRCQDP